MYRQQKSVTQRRFTNGMKKNDVFHWERIFERKAKFISLHLFIFTLDETTKPNSTSIWTWLTAWQTTHQSSVESETVNQKKVRKKTDRPFILDSRWFRHIWDIIDTRTIEDDRSRSRCRHKENFFMVPMMMMMMMMVKQEKRGHRFTFERVTHYSSNIVRFWSNSTFLFLFCQLQTY